MSDHEDCDRYLWDVKSELSEAKEEIKKLRNLLGRGITLVEITGYAMQKRLPPKTVQEWLTAAREVADQGGKT